MGYYTMSCALSNITIKKDDKVWLFPMTFKNNKDILLNPYLNTVQNNFQLLNFPIAGIYNGQDSLINIEKNEHTNNIEKYYGFSIEEYVDIIFCIRDYHDSYGELYKHYGNKKLSKKQNFALHSLIGSTAMFILDDIYKDFVVDKIDCNLIMNEFNIMEFKEKMLLKPKDVITLKNETLFVDEIISNYFHFSFEKIYDVNCSMFLQQLLETEELMKTMINTNRFFIPSFSGLQHKHKDINIKLKEMIIEDLKKMNQEDASNA